MQADNNTALSILRKWAEQQYESSLLLRDAGGAVAFELIKEKIDELMTTEKNQIIDAYDDAWAQRDFSRFGSEYYERKFNKK